jgi:hypothetical protein
MNALPFAKRERLKSENQQQCKKQLHFTFYWHFCEELD